MSKILSLRNFFKYGIVYLLPLLLITGGLSFMIYHQNIRSFMSLMSNNEKQILDFQEELIGGNLKNIQEDINYLANMHITRRYVQSGFNPKIDLPTIYASFLNRKKIYSSVRIIDSGGLERFRMDYDNKISTRISKENLQSKGHRYYFNEIMNLKPGEIYFSRLDFNYEHGKLQYPLEPVLRLARLLVNGSGTKTAFIILNYRGKALLNLMDRTSKFSFGKIFIRNNQGLLVPLNLLMAKEDKTAITNFLKTDRGKLLLQSNRGQLNIDSGSLMHKKIKIADIPINSEWDLISFVDRSSINKQTFASSVRGLIVFMVLALLSVATSFLMARNKVNRIKSNAVIQERARIFDYNPAPVLKVSKNGEILSSNVAAKAILGLTSAPPSIQSVFNRLDKRIFNQIDSNDIFTFEYRIKEKTYYMATIKEKSSGQIFFYGTDITENSRIREELKNFQIAVKQSANVIVFTDLEGRILFVNDAFKTVTGYSSEEVLGKKPSVLNSGYHSNSFYENLWNTIDSGKVWTGEFYNKRKDGSFFWEKSTISPVLDGEGKPRFFIAVKEDITEKKEIESELKTQTQNAETARINAEQARAEAESANILKSSFLANMSHEIRTPMNAILGFTRLLLDKEIHKNDREMLEIIMNSGTSLLSLINDILDFSKIEANEIEISTVKINIPNFFESIKGMFTIQTKQKSLDFNIELSNYLPKIVFGDENRLRQILINIIGNAIKFTDKGSIEVTVDWISDNLNISITDTGIGIADNKLEEIFSPFKQTDSSIDRKYEGTGLGLAISLRLTKLMGGELTVESKISEGSTFTVILPLKPCLDSVGFSDKDNSTKTNNSRRIVEGWLQKVKNDKTLTSILKDAVSSLPRHFNRLENVILSNNFEEIQAISHELMGSTGNLGMKEIYDLLKELNSGIKNKNINKNQIRKIFRNAREIIDGIPKEYLEEFAAELLPVEVEGDKIDINILTADDSSANRLLIKAMLSSIFVESDFAEDGIEVLEKLKNKKYDILLLDIQMPKMNGIETIKKIRENEEYNDMYVFAVTANAMKGDAQKYLDIGCNDYISKPIQKDLFLKKIEHQIQITKLVSNQLELSPDSDEIDIIISSLEQEIKIFNPGRVIEIAAKLSKYSANKSINIIIGKLTDSAESFNSHGLNSIITMLKELKSNAKE